MTLKKNKKGYVFFILLFLIGDLIFLYFIKYQNQNLPLSEFRINNIGNILNLSFTVFLISGIIFYTLKTKINFKLNILFSECFLITLFLFTAYISTKISLPFSKTYIFDHPFNKFIIASLFLIFQILTIIFMCFVWLSISEKKEYTKSRTVINSLIIFIALFVFAFIFSNLSRWDIKEIKNLRAKSVAVVLGAAVWSDNKPSPSLESRANKAVELYNKGTISKIQLTGGNAPGELSEARAAYNYLLKKNIDTSDVWIEENTTSTTEQINFIKNELIDRKKIKDIVIISDAYHLARVNEICKFYNIKVNVAASDFTLSLKDKIYNNFRESIALTIFWLFAL